nr:oligosaccharide flippase family protein [uncultured Chryseobacterium sp.]
MKSLISFLKGFLKNEGHYVFTSLLIGKICGFLTSLFIIKMLPTEDFGKMSIVAAIFAVFSACNGLGSHQSLLRFGSIADSDEEKRNLSAYLIKKGFYYQLLLSVLFLTVSFFYVSKYEDVFYIFLLFCVRLIGFYFLSYVQSELRIHNKNKEFAGFNNMVSIAGFAAVLILTYFFHLKGYLFAMAITPFLSLFWLKKSTLKKTGQLSGRFNIKEIWQYGFNTSATTLLSEALFSADIIIISFLLNEDAVADYRVAILIPSNVTFLALSFMQSDFHSLAKNYQNAEYLKNYINGYYRFFIPLCLLIFTVSFLFSKDILILISKEHYAGSSSVFILFMATFLMNILFRNLYGNLLSAIGKMSINTKGSALSLTVLIFLSFLLVPRYHILGMAVSVSITMISSGFFFLYHFNKYIKKLK